MKDAIEKQNKRFSQEIKENSLDSSEKANQLSLYIDDQIKRLTEEFMRKNEKLKQIFSKLAEQFKNHLITYDATKRELTQKNLAFEKLFEDEHNLTSFSFKNLEISLQKQVKDSKYELETLLLSKFTVVADKCMKLQEQLNSDIDLVKEAIDNSRAMLLNKLNKTIEQYGIFHKEHHENFKNVLFIINELKNGIKALDEENYTNLEDISNKIMENEAKEYLMNLTEKTVRESQFSEFYGLIRETAEDIHKGMYDLKIKVENEERTRMIEKDQNADGLEQLNAKMNVSKEEFEKFCQDFRVK